MGTAVGALAGAGVGYGAQVVGNTNRGMDLRQALTTDIDPGKIVQGAFVGAIAGTAIATGVGLVATGAVAVGAGTTAAGAASGVATAVLSDDGRAGELNAVQTAAGSVDLPGVGSQIGRLLTPDATREATEMGVRFGQRGISEFFRHGEFAGKSIYEIAAGLREGTISPDRVPISVVLRDGVYYTINNRSLMALRLAGLEPTVIRDLTSDPHWQSELTRRLAEIGCAVDRYFMPFIRQRGQR